ncbi:DUF2167 domain-containing protein [Simiduia curdlanivorans]|uniref:DUF2167 domain-containing protein n=1 Tax=Simiduia curdlanivorans TaxID=1492769 RepID=A0ABV8V5X5_9GAMM|nr:DUF2167 domain-containing protein [Simiduia curdlanivorans]MDN3638405.1 DUF2167 domain-containing protein [Simiduia curdlanivorans]
MLNVTRLTLALLLISSLTSISFAQTTETAAPETPSSETINAETTDTELSSEEQAYQQWAVDFLDSLNPQTGTIALPGGIANLEVPEGFYYLSPEDAKRVLEEAWGNPESELGWGMLFPAGYTPIDGAAWGVTIDYEAEGHVADEDAAEIDYDELLEDMQADTKSESTFRVDAGFDAISLIGWAAQPYYDAETHKLYWAKELKFGDAEENTLNYNVRILGREGVLVLNFIASMPQLAEIEAARNDVLAMASFTDGNRYTQFDPAIDQVAAYGIGGLIAGKVLAKTGLIAVALVFLKKFWFLLFLPLIWLKNVIFKKKDAQQTRS